MRTYSQTSGEIRFNTILEGVGYSGYGPGFNNPSAEADPDIGPIPRGMWRIVRWDDVHGEKGPVVAVLEPVGHIAHGRTAFLIHGAHQNDHHDSSHGCIIAGRIIRENWRASGDMDLEVDI